MPKTFTRILAPAASLKLTVALMTALLLLIFFGTLAQRSQGIWWVMDQYFGSWGLWVPLAIFTPLDRPMPRAFPFPGGATLGTLLLINLIAAHALRFKLKARGLRLIAGLVTLAAGIALLIGFHHGPWPHTLSQQLGLMAMLAIGAAAYIPTLIGAALLFDRRMGIVLIHGALILLIGAEIVAQKAKLETQMPIYEGQTTHWAHDMRVSELAVIDASDPTRDQVTAIPEALLIQAAQTGEPITHPSLPFAIRVDTFFPNSTFGPRGPVVEPAPPAMRGLGQRFVLGQVSPATGVGDQMYNFPGARITLIRDGQPDTIYLVSTITNLMGDLYQTIRQDVDRDGAPWQLDLRFKRYYQPYSLHLIEFTHDLYPGTNVPSNYASDLHLINPVTGDDRDIHIKMNHPLRYQGQTFFQSGYIPGDRGTILQVVRNPGWSIPYIACALGGFGLVIHFALSLSRFLGRQRP